MTCPGRCQGYRIPRKGRHAVPASCYCAGCQTAMAWDGVFCPCCGRRVRRRYLCTRSSRAQLEAGRARI